MDWDRVEERAELWTLFDTGHNIAMFAPRRLGKSWLMKNLLTEDAENNGWCALYSDLQGDNTAEKAIKTLLSDIQVNTRFTDSLRNTCKTLLQSLRDGAVATTLEGIADLNNWETQLDVVLKGIAQQPQRTLIMLDEVTVCATNIFEQSVPDGKLFLNTLRKMRDRYPSIKWMLTGSIGIDHLAGRYQMQGAFNNLHPFGLKPFSQAIAQTFTTYFCQTGTAKAFDMTQETHHYLQQRLGWLSPFYIEKLCLQIRPVKSGDTYMCAQGDVEAACDRLLEHPNHQAFSGWPDHVNRNVPADQQAGCRAILDYLACNKEGEQLDTIHATLHHEYAPETIKRLLRTLVTDGFLQQNKQSSRYAFTMPLLADYWQEYQ